ncbi:MAG TPA: hypothetical protein VGE53_01200 [Candidatus Paceibacterota bacterium]
MASNEWPPEAKKPDAKIGDRSAERRRRGGGEHESDPSVDALVSKLSDTMNSDARVHEAMRSHAQTQRYAERLSRVTQERHEQEEAVHREKLEAAKGRLKRSAEERKGREARLKELRHELSELNRVGAHKDVDAEVDRLEQEIYALENDKKAIGKGADTMLYEGEPHHKVPALTSDTRREKQEALKDALAPVFALPDHSKEAVSADTTLYEGEPHYPVPARIPDTYREKEAASANSDAPHIDDSDLRAKEAAYLKAYQEVVREKTFFKRVFKADSLKEKERKLDDLRHEFDLARESYAAKIKGRVTQDMEISDSFRQRKTKEYEALQRTGEIGAGVTLESYLESESGRRRDAVGRYLAFREVVRPLAEQKRAAREEALDSRGRNALEKALGWSARYNQKLEERFGKLGAKAVRAAAGAMVVSGGVGLLAVAGVTAPMGIAALAGFGTFRFARALGGSIIAASAAETAAHGFEALWGRRNLKSARKQQVTEGRDSDITLESLKKTDKSRDRLAKEGSEITLIKRKQLVRALTALGVGGAVAATLAEFAPVHAATDAAADSSGDSASEAAAAVKDAPVANASDAEVSMGDALREVTIGKGEGFNTLFQSIRASEFPYTTAVGKMLGDAGISPTELSDRIGAFDPETGKSMVMLEGDRLVVDAKQNVWFVREGETPRIVLENDPTAPGGVRIHELSGQRMLASAPQGADIPASPVEDVNPAVAPRPNALEENDSSEPGPEGAPEPASAGSQPPAEQESTGATSAVPEREIRSSGPDTSSASETSNVFDDPYTNVHGVEIDPSEPHVYQNAEGSFFMSGGTKDAVYEAAQEFALAQDVPVFVDASYVDALGNTVRRAAGFMPDGQGGVGIMPSSDPEVQVRPEEYIRRVR